MDDDDDDYSDDDDHSDSDEELSMVDIRARVLGAGFTESQLSDAIQEVRFELIIYTVLNSQQYEHMNVWMRVANGSKLRFIETEGS